MISRRFAPVPVSELEPGCEVLLPNGKTVTVERVDRYPAARVGAHTVPACLVARWTAGQDIGSLQPLPGDACVTARMPLRKVAEASRAPAASSSQSDWIPF